MPSNVVLWMFLFGLGKLPRGGIFRNCKCGFHPRSEDSSLWVKIGKGNTQEHGVTSLAASIGKQKKILALLGLSLKLLRPTGNQSSSEIEGRKNDETDI